MDRLLNLLYTGRGPHPPCVMQEACCRAILVRRSSAACCVDWLVLDTYVRLNLVGAREGHQLGTKGER